ncbi:MAG: protein kinase [Gemmataceae bacterium]|nr:protein kinase [Gemmataceae bacterium]
MTERDLFLSALDLPPADRPAFLDRACAGHPDLRRKVGDLLAAHAAAGSFLEPPAEASGGRQPPDTIDHQGADAPRSPVTSALPPDPPDRTSHHSPTPDAGTVLGGKYKLVEPIGEGGMGTVWMAQQTEPVRRVVAVKLIKAGMDSRAVLARFEAERQALAMMDHPNIAKVLDAGATPDGRPYFVLELVKGVPITAFCDARKLTPRQRLELFVPVCQAVQHAHQKGVIHRDIKPSNVLVSMYDDRPVPKVIDFGVAKAAGQPLTDHTLLTGFGAVVGTPEYMSPEQASFNQLDVDTRSDVYSLGVLLYELLTGTTPVDRKSLGKAAVLEVLRIVREVEAPRPSHKLSTADALPSIAANRGTEPRRLSALVRGELDWIVMRALEKDRTRRYETANGFAADVQRYLSGEPVQAVPPSAGYRLRKFVRRNRAAVLVAAGFLLLTWVGASGIYFAYRRAVAAEADAVASAREANDERQKADAARRVADEERVKAENYAARVGVDLALDLCKRDSRLGLLHLARLLRTIPSDLTDLRQCVALNVLAWGQEIRPLLPDLTHDGEPPNGGLLSPDGLTVITHSTGRSSRLWDVPTARVRVALGGAEGFNMQMGFSPDGRAVWATDKRSRVRLWDAATGRQQLEVSVRPEWLWDVVVSPGARRVLVGVAGGGPDHLQDELWDVQAGRRLTTFPVIRLPGLSAAFHPAGEQILVGGAGGTLQVRSAVDGRLLADLTGPHRNDRPEVYAVAFNPDGSLAVSGDGETVRWWRTADWQAVGESAVPLRRYGGRLAFLDRETVFLQSPDPQDTGLTVARLGSPPTPVASTPTRIDGTRLVTVAGEVYDLTSRGPVLPRADRRYHTEARRLVGSRLLVGTTHLNDLVTERMVGADDSCWAATRSPVCPFVLIGRFHDWEHLRVLPIADASIPPQDLELWAQVVARGELTPADEFVRWDEPIWERKRAELATRPQPLPGFPFPGVVAEDRGYWLRREWTETADADKPRLAAELLRRAEALGDAAEATRWRLELDKLGLHVAPPPRPVKR